MFDIARCKPVVASILLGGLAFAASPVIAHPPHSPYDDSVFAPIKRFGPRVAVEVLASGLVAPLKGVTAPGDPDHLYVVDQTGQAWKVNIHTKQRTLFFDVASRLVTLGVLGDNSFDERGFLGLAFHPDYANNRLLYTYTSEPSGGGTPTFPTTLPAGVAADHQNVVAEWRVTANGIANRRELMRVDWPQFNHDGGDLAFGPDGLLYISMGDGGGADDKDGQLFIRGDRSGLEAPIVGHGPDGNGQKLTNPLGKILRIDVNGRNSANGQYGIPKDNPFRGMGGGRLAEIYAYGFRNPYRFSFDRLKGTIFVGDVGQNDIEEVDVVRKGGNYGWRIKEGTMFFNPNEAETGFAQRMPVPGVQVPPNLIDPVAQYDTHHEGHSVVAGFVYRGRALHGLYGRFIFGEFSTIFNFPTGPHDYGRLLHISGHDGGKGLRAISEFHIVGGNSLGFAVLGMGEDAEGEVYLTGNRSGLPFGNAGMVLKIVPAPDERHDQDDED